MAYIPYPKGIGVLRHSYKNQHIRYWKAHGVSYAAKERSQANVREALHPRIVRNRFTPNFT